MLNRLCEWMHLGFDELNYLWEQKRTQNVVNTFILIFFVSLLGLIEFKRNGLLPAGLFPGLPTNPFYAVYYTFSFLLVVEVIKLIFVLPASVSRSVGKQLEILTLYFLRNAFKELINFTEPIRISGHIDALLHLGSLRCGRTVLLWRFCTGFRVFPVRRCRRSAPTKQSPYLTYCLQLLNKYLTLRQVHRVNYLKTDTKLQHNEMCFWKLRQTTRPLDKTSR